MGRECYATMRKNKRETENVFTILQMAILCTAQRTIFSCGIETVAF